jgi:hypothetical protein
MHIAVLWAGRNSVGINIKSQSGEGSTATRMIEWGKASYHRSQQPQSLSFLSRIDSMIADILAVYRRPSGLL